MGTILDGYGEAAYDHEGYPAQVLDDGTITGTSSRVTRPRMIGQVVAACGCGWAGTTGYPCPEPFDETAEDLALAEWEHHHARPALDRDRAGRWDRLRRLVGDIQAHLLRQGGSGPGEVELLERALRDLTTATDLARELRGQAAQQGEQGAS